MAIRCGCAATPGRAGSAPRLVETSGQLTGGTAPGADHAEPRLLSPIFSQTPGTPLFSSVSIQEPSENTFVSGFPWSFDYQRGVRSSGVFDADTSLLFEVRDPWDFESSVRRLSSSSLGTRPS